MEHIARNIQADHPQFRFVVSPYASWSPRDNEIRYTLSGIHAIASMLHELAHALLNHQTYQTDLDLLNKEVTAWEHATKLAERYSVTLDPDHIQDCLDTYRDWVHKRSTCPNCHANGLQTASIPRYSCINCGQQWRVSNSRFCRSYRRTAATKKSQDNHVPALSRFV